LSEISDHRNGGLLRARRERPKNGRRRAAAEEPDERAPIHSITSVGAQERFGNGQAERLCRLEVDEQPDFVGCVTGASLRIVRVRDTKRPDQKSGLSVCGSGATS
jgi:hypothetical protein